MLILFTPLYSSERKNSAYISSLMFLTFCPFRIGWRKDVSILVYLTFNWDLRHSQTDKVCAEIADINDLEFFLHELHVTQMTSMGTWRIDLFRLGGLFFHYRPRPIFREFLYPSKSYSFIYTWLFENLKARILKSIITWSVMGQQTAQSKRVYVIEDDNPLVIPKVHFALTTIPV